MLRILFCISCCGAPPTNRADKQRSRTSSSQNLKKTDTSDGSDQSASDDANKRQELAPGKGLIPIIGASEKDKLLAERQAVDEQNEETHSRGAGSQNKASQPVQGNKFSELQYLDEPSASDDRDDNRNANDTDNDDNKRARIEANSLAQASTLDNPAAAAASSATSNLQRQEALDETSTRSATSERPIISELEANNTNQQLKQQQVAELVDRKRAYQQSSSYNDESISSIEIDQFTESSTSGNRLPPRESFEKADTIYKSEKFAAKMNRHASAEEHKSAVLAPGVPYRPPTEQANQNQKQDPETGGQSSSSSTLVMGSSLATDAPSTTKIGDYARIEYSPVEDLDSVTTMSFSRGGSEPGGPRSQTGSQLSRQNSLTRPSNALTGSPSDADDDDEEGDDYDRDRDRDQEVGGRSGGSPDNRGSADRRRLSKSRRSSQGFESTSISIASQLSNEQLQQTLTNALESANSPQPLFGTIGLPLGPPLLDETGAGGGGAAGSEGGRGLRDDTAKTSPETTGAALTSASQDSLSDGDQQQPRRPQAGTTSSNASTGAALVADPLEDSMDLGVALGPPAPASDAKSGAAAASTTAPLASGEPDLYVGRQPAAAGSRFGAGQQVQVQAPARPPAGERAGSPQSTATSNSDGLMTNPTPTPSELSAASSGKKRRLKAKSLFKRLKPGSKKKANQAADEEAKSPLV